MLKTNGFGRHKLKYRGVSLARPRLFVLILLEAGVKSPFEL